MNDKPHLAIVDDPHVNEPPALPEHPTVEVAPADDAVPQQQWFMHVADVPWPEPDDESFRIQVPDGAVFQRAYRAEVHNKIMNRRKSVMRFVWLALVGAPCRVQHFGIQRFGYIVEVPVDGSGGQHLGTLIDSRNEPIAIWRFEVVPEPAVPEQVPPEKAEIVETQTP